MKKTLIAMAAVAVAGVASAQVTIYGVVDAGIVNDGTDTSFASGVNGTPRIGFKGTEDLGGGLSVAFTVETGFSNAAESATSIGDRGARVSMSGGFGTVELGSSVLSASFFARAATDPTGTNNYAIATYAGSTRNDSSINYTSPNIGGAVVRYSTVLSADSANTDAVSDISVTYTAGALTIGAASNDDGGTTGKGKSIGIAYNMGMAKVFGNSVTTAATQVKTTNFGLNVPMGAMTLEADFRTTADDDVDANMVAAQYALSKATKVTVFRSKIQGSDASMGVGIRHNF